MVDYTSVNFMPKGSEYFGRYFNAFDMFAPTYDTSGNLIRQQMNGQEIPQEVGIGNFGTTANPSKDPLEELSSKIKEGATALELGFTGQGKGYLANGQTTPGTFGEQERQAIQMLSQENQIKLSTHASITLTGFAGLTRDQETYGWKFDDTKRLEAEKEAEQTIDFAADTARGGAIVIHAGEFFRDIVNAPNNFDNEEGKGFFESYTGQRKKIKDYAEKVSKGEEPNAESEKDKKNVGEFHFQLGKVARADTGEIEKVYRDVPILMEKEEWNLLSSKIDKMHSDIEGIQKSDKSREEKLFEIKDIKHNCEKSINEEITNFEHIYADKELKKLRPDIFKEGKSEIDVGKGKNIEKIDYAEVLQRVGFDYGEADKIFHRLRLSQDFATKKSEVERYRAAYDDAQKDLNALNEAFKIQEEIEKNTPESERWKLKKKAVKQRVQDMGIIPDEYKMPTEFLTEQIRQNEDQLRHLKSSLMGMQQNLTMIESQIGSMNTPGNLRSVAELGLEKSADTISMLGLHAMKRWTDLEGANENKEVQHEKLIELARAHNIDWEEKSDDKIRKELDEHALYVAPENMMPDFGPTGEPAYGGHPRELKEIILKAREAMVEKLKRPEDFQINMRELGFSKDRLEDKEAQEYAERHIKATFDIGHANTWRKFFHGDPGSKKTEDEQFKDWLTGQVKDLVDSNIIGHVHITDNFGYADDHISPGEGGAKRGAPIADFTKIILDAENKGPNARGGKAKEPWVIEYPAMLHTTWHKFGHPIYRSGTGIPGPSFGFMEQSYLTSSYNSRVFNEAGLSPGQNRQTGWSGAPLL